MLAAFPNLGIHQTYGGVVLKAGSGWTGFRGSVDSLAIGIDGATTTFDFGVSARRYRLQTAIDSSVVAAHWPRDTTYAGGNRLGYAFTARPGHRTPLVLLDDSLVAPSGQILMDRDRLLRVESDTIYTYAALRPLERTIADLLGALLTSPDKVAAQQALLDYYLQSDLNGVNGDSLSRAEVVARTVMVEQVRDSAALRQIDDALDGYNFYTRLEADGSFTTWNEVSVPVGDGGGEISSRQTAGGGMRSSTAFGAPLQFRRSTPRRLIRPFGRAHRSIASTGRSRDVAVANQPTLIIYTNGVLNQDKDARDVAELIRDLVTTSPELQNGITTVDYKYNPTQSVQFAEYMRDHPCHDRISTGSLAEQDAYSACVAGVLGQVVVSNDFIEAAWMKVQAFFHRRSSDKTVRELADLISFNRSQGTNVFLVGHSQGTLVDALALQRIATLPGHQVSQAGDACIGAVALAPAATRASYGLDPLHLYGFMAENDAIRAVNSPNGWESFANAETRAADTAITNNPWSTVLGFRLGIHIHYVNPTYVLGVGGQLLAARLDTLHKECTVASLSVSPSTATLAVNEVTGFTAVVRNRNGRPLVGRAINWNVDNERLIQVDSASFRALLPTYTQFPAVVTVTSGGLEASANVTIPLVHLGPPHYIDTISSYGGWEAIGASNGDQDSPPTPAAPTDLWDGSSPCGEIRRVDGVGTSWVEYQLVGCDRIRTITDTVSDTLASGAHVTTYLRWRVPLMGVIEAPSVHCGDQACPEPWVDQEVLTFIEAVNPRRSFSYVVATSRNDGVSASRMDGGATSGLVTGRSPAAAPRARAGDRGRRDPISGRLVTTSPIPATQSGFEVRR